MRLYPTPVHLKNFEEKWIGGRYTSRQLLYVGAGIVTGLVFWFVLFFLPWMVRLVLELPMLYAVNRLASSRTIPKINMRYDQLLLLRYRYKQKPKRYYYGQKETRK